MTDDEFSSPREPTELPETVKRLTRDLVQAARTLSDDEARFLVDNYYINQENRKRTTNQLRSMSDEPHELLTWTTTQNETIEGQIKRALEVYTDTKAIGLWMKSLYGIGPVIAAGIIAHIDINQAPTVGHIWRYAGLDPTVKWEKGERRPWNAELKTLCWKTGQSFMKFSNIDACYYGNVLYKSRKVYELNRNERGDNVELAAELAPKFKPKTDAHGWLTGCYKPRDYQDLRAAGPVTLAGIKSIKGEKGSGTPMLPPAQIDGRARRYAVKIFLSHTHEVWYWLENKTLTPNPFAIAHKGHVDYLSIPNCPPGLSEARAAAVRASFQ